MKYTDIGKVHWAERAWDIAVGISMMVGAVILGAIGSILMICLSVSPIIIILLAIKWIFF